MQFQQLEEAPKVLAPYMALWTTALDFQKNSYMWLNGPMTALDPEVLEKDVKEMWKANFKCMKSFDPEMDPSLGAPYRVSETVKQQMDDFQAKLPLISCLCNKGLRDRHWEDISKILGYPFKPNDSTTLSSVLTMRLDPHLEMLEEIANSASKEYSLEKALDKMHTEWQPLEFIVRDWRDTGTCIVGGTEDIQALLDDHIVKSQTMQGSPFIRPFEERARTWAGKLLLIQDLIDIWLKARLLDQRASPKNCSMPT